jgi:hypothetical protein
MVSRLRAIHHAPGCKPRSGTHPEKPNVRPTLIPHFPPEVVMNTGLAHNKDFLAGLLLLGFGTLGMYLALDYPFGSSLRMGPGYFPRVLAGIIIAFGVFVMVRGILSNERVKGVWGVRALLLISLAFILFGWIMDRYGMIPALIVMFLVGARAGHEFKLLEVVILTVLMSVFAVVLFVYGLGLPYQLIQGWN